MHKLPQFLVLVAALPPGTFKGVSASVCGTDEKRGPPLSEEKGHGGQIGWHVPPQRGWSEES